MRDITTIQLRKQTREELKKCGPKGSTYDEIITNLIIDAKSQGVGKTPQPVTHPRLRNEGAE